MQIQFPRRGKDTRWQETDKIVADWLDERQELLVIYYKLCEIKPTTYISFTADYVKNFISLLVDYVSAGHFEVFEKIAEVSEQSPNIPYDKSLLVKILYSTNKALTFSDRYAENENYSNLCEDLADLGQELIARFDLEDQLIAIYLEATQCVEPSADMLDSNEPLREST